jgi:ketosteroid isomerase-like protein
MTEKDIELVRRAYSSWELSSRLDPDLFADDFVFHPVVTGSETSGRQYVGQAGWRDYLEAVSEVWSSIRTKTRELRSLSPGVVLFEGELHGVGRTSGASVKTTIFSISRIRDGRIVEMRVYPTLDEALTFAATYADVSR